MMDAHEKSDSAVVAGKPSNKAGQPGAEPVEQRAEAEGNAGQQSTRRAQNRESVSQALERIRQVARQRKKEKFTSLFHHISNEHLRKAYFELKKDAAPGVDGLTWRAYEADLERSLVDLHARLERGAYCAFRYHVTDLWRRSLRQRSQKDHTTWKRITQLVDDFLPNPRILHPWPNVRFAVKHPRWEPSARIGPARICAGGAQ
jgi:hypothetical protein